MKHKKWNEKKKQEEYSEIIGFICDSRATGSLPVGERLAPQVSLGKN